MIKDMRIFFTGGAGLIGTKLCERLCNHNHIMLYDNLNRNAIKKTELLNRPNIELVQGDILDFNLY